MAAGKMRARLAFQARQAADDGFGTIIGTGDFETQFVEFAELTPRFGGEGVMAGRLQGTQPYTVRVRQSGRTRLITSAWRAKDQRSGTLYSIVAPPVDPTQKGAYLDILVTAGTGGQ